MKAHVLWSSQKHIRPYRLAAYIVLLDRARRYRVHHWRDSLTPQRALGIRPTASLGGLQQCPTSFLTQGFRIGVSHEQLHPDVPNEAAISRFDANEQSLQAQSVTDDKAFGRFADEWPHFVMNPAADAQYPGVEALVDTEGLLATATAAGVECCVVGSIRVGCTSSAFARLDYLRTEDEKPDLKPDLVW